MTTLTLEERVAALEQEVEILKKVVATLKYDRNPWWLRQFANTPEDSEVHEEFRKYLRETREAELAEFDKANEQ